MQNSAHLLVLWKLYCQLKNSYAKTFFRIIPAVNARLKTEPHPWGSRLRPFTAVDEQIKDNFEYEDLTYLLMSYLFFILFYLDINFFFIFFKQTFSKESRKLFNPRY